MKEKYPDLADFDNLQFVRTCAEDGVRKYKVMVKEVFKDMRKDRCDCDNISEHFDKCYMCELFDKAEKRLELE